MKPGQDSQVVVYLFNFTVRLNAGKPERVFSKYFKFSLSYCIQKISPQVWYLVVMLHIKCGLTALVFIFLMAIHIGWGKREIILRNFSSTKLYTLMLTLNLWSGVLKATEGSYTLLKLYLIISKAISSPLAFQRCRLHGQLTGSKYLHDTVPLGQKQHPWFSIRQPARDLGEHHTHSMAPFYLNYFSPPSCNGSHRQGNFHPHPSSTGRRTSLEISQLHWDRLNLKRMKQQGPVKVSQPEHQLLLLEEWKAFPQTPDWNYLPSFDELFTCSAGTASCEDPTPGQIFLQICRESQCGYCVNHIQPDLPKSSSVPFPTLHMPLLLSSGSN